MRNPSQSIAGYRLTDHTRITELGAWFDAISPDGRLAGALRFDQGVIGLPGVRDRLVAAVVTDRRLAQGGVPGLVPVADVVAAGEQVWLLSGQGVSPALSELLVARAVDAPGAAAVLVETAQTLLTLHASHVAHGSLHPGTIVLSQDGAALMIERGLVDAVRGQAPSAERDVSAWAALARTLALGVSSQNAAALFERAAAAAAEQGLTAARDTLLGQRDALPGGQITRDRLAMEVRNRTTLEIGNNPIPARDEGEIFTLLHVPGSSRTPEDQHFNPTAQEQHFGPGVGTDPPHMGTTAERIWRAGRDQLPASRSGKRTGRVARARRRRTIMSAVLFAVVMAGALLAWFRLSGAPPLEITTIEVTPQKKTVGCVAETVVFGKVGTNGGAGDIVFEWTQGDTGAKYRNTQRATSDRTTYSLPFKWKLGGKSTTKLTATLTVLSPTKLKDKATFTYKC
ncbi:hypothetical protein OIE66_05625 [Nonomuraea sp. NBC_01738]|uniref:hypothetical protein n=1 Tax=Nonomuraea sp. NBC_01738 TaxID=2976003 RepID=UPI002E12EAB6|nr:hypothetical protein OIE66_05625 [Nonomuraea sp. NBC_01738]